MGVWLVGVQDPNGLRIKAPPEPFSVGHVNAEVLCDLSIVKSPGLGLI